MISAARRSAFETLCEILIRGAFSDHALNSSEISALESRDRNLVTEIVYGTLRWLALLDDVLRPFACRPWRSLDEPLKILLRMSVYQLWHMDRVPDYAVINDAVEIAKQKLGRGIAAFTNGVLRSLNRDRRWSMAAAGTTRPPWIRASLPQFLWERWAKRYGAVAAMEFALSLNEAPRPAIRFIGQNIPDDFQTMGFRSSDCVPGAFLLREGELLPDGWSNLLRIQDEASQLIPQLLGNALGAWIWDVCAAPGGKSAILADMCGEAGKLVASDISHDRALFLRRSLCQHMNRIPNVLVADASLPPPFRRSFDSVLADVPCSGLGTLRRNPEIKWRFHPTRFKSLGIRQYGIIHAIASVVRPGGQVLYATCSTEPEENEEIVARFLDTHKNFRLQTPEIPPGARQWLNPDGMFRTFPCSRPWDGFFAALMVRKD